MEIICLACGQVGGVYILDLTAYPATVGEDADNRGVIVPDFTEPDDPPQWVVTAVAHALPGAFCINCETMIRDDQYQIAEE